REILRQGHAAAGRLLPDPQKVRRDRESHQGTPGLQENSGQATIRSHSRKLVCMKCETYMNFEKVEKPGEGSLGVFFGCPSCGARFTMVTNPGETQMVSSLGVQLGGRTAAAEPFEMTRGGLRAEGPGEAEMANYLNEHYGDKPVSTTATESSEKKSGCPLSAVVAQIGLGSSSEAGATMSEFILAHVGLGQLGHTPS